MLSCAARRRAVAPLAFSVACVIQASAQTPSALKFAYSGDEGPGFWGSIAKACEAAPSAHQSPVDIRNASADWDLKPLDLILAESSFQLTNTGYTVEAEPSIASTLILNGSSFTLKNFHFHTLSEHTIQGEHFAMELHVVFQYAETKKRAVIGVLYQLGEANPFIEKLLRTGLPAKSTSPPLHTRQLGLEEALTDTARYYTYPGSLTVPPCDEDLTWFVLKQRAQISKAQFEAFRVVLGNDFRPVQELNDRVILRTAN